MFGQGVKLSLAGVCVRLVAAVQLIHWMRLGCPEASGQSIH